MSLDERTIVAAMLASRQAFDRVRPVLSAKDFSEQGERVVRSVIAWYHDDPDAQSVDVVAIKSAVGRTLLNPKHIDAVTSYIDELPAPSSPLNVASEYRALRRHNIGLEIAGELAQGHHGDKTSALIDKYQHLATEAETASPRPSADELHEAVSTTGRIRIHPRVINDRLRGGLSPGEHAIFFGRPNAGKTLLAINVAGNCLLDGHRVLYAVNEEPREKYAARLLARVSGVPVNEIENSRDSTVRAMEKANGAWKRLALVDLTTGRIPEIETLIRAHKPAVVVIDQMRNLKAAGENRVLELDAIARELRQIARREQVVMISVTQAGDSAEGKLQLSMSDVDWSKTGIQGACDLMIGIGVTPEARSGQRRRLSFPKNKVGHDEEPVDVFLEPELSLVLSKRRN